VFTNIFKLDIGNISYKYNLTIAECEILYDWLINEAFKRLLINKCEIQNHYRHDVYKCVYDEYGHELQHILKRIFVQHSIHFVLNERIKLLIAGESILIARGSLTS
jgi:hypothetical protein